MVSNIRTCVSDVVLFGAVYTEGLFFFLTIFSFYLFQSKKFLAASIFGSFASATRIAGLFIAPAQIIHKKFKINITAFGIPAGFLLYVLFLKIKYNNPLYFFTAQSVFGQERSQNFVVLPQVIYRYLKILLTTKGLIFINAAFELVMTLVVFCLLYLAFKKKINTHWLTFSFLAILIPTFTGTLTSMPRYVLMAFPIYIVLAQIQNNFIKIAILFFSIILLLICTSLFTRGYWVA